MALTLTTALLTLATANFAPIVQFYAQLLEQNPDRLIPNVYAEFHLPDLKLGIFCPQQAPNLPSVSVKLPQLSLCLEVTDLEAAIAHLTQLGYPPPGEVLTASHGREIYAYDPDGNCLILHQGT
jgi:hypothetical protein